MVNKCHHVQLHLIYFHSWFFFCFFFTKMNYLKSQIWAHLMRKLPSKQKTFHKCNFFLNFLSIFRRVQRKRSVSKLGYLMYCIFHFKMLSRKSNELTAVKEGVSDFWLSADMLLSPFCSSKIPKRMFFLSLWIWLSHMHPVVTIHLLTKTVWVSE